MKEPIFLALLFVFSLSAFAHESITKLKDSDNRTIQWYGKETNGKKGLAKELTQHVSTNTDNLYRNKRDTPCIPGEEPLTVTTNVSEINDNSSFHTVFSIMNSLNQGTKNIKYSSYPNIILLLGLSGAGKSTLAQYLFGNNSNLISVAKKNSWCEATGDFYIEDNAKKIGHNTVLSHTELPDLLIDPETNIPIYDCPGFSDTRDPEHDISGAYFIKAVTDKAKALKFIFVVNYNSVTIGANREEFMTLARHAANMINNISKYRESIALVATKIKDDKSDKQRIIAITDFLQSVRRTLKNTNKEPSVQLFIDILLTTSGPNNRDYTRIGFMPKFDTEGPLIDMPVVQAHKKSLLTIIHYNMVQFTIIDPTDLKPTISSNSIYYIDGLVNEVTQQMWVNIQNVVQKVQVFYDDLIKNMLDTIHSFKDEKIMIDTDQSKARLFFAKLNKGSSVISEIVKNIKGLITFNELSEFIITSPIISEVNLSQDIISNITTQHEYLKFLLTVHEHRHSFNVDAVIILFENLESHLAISRNIFSNNVSDVIDQMTNTISSIDNNIMKEIQKKFSSFTPSSLDYTKMYSLINAEHSKLLEIRNLANNENIFYKCINQIQRTVNHINFTGTNIKSVNHIIQNISKLVNYLNFLQILKNQYANRNSLQCTDEINRVISYLEDLSKWYELLIHLFEKFSGYRAHRFPGECNQIAMSLLSYEDPASEASYISQKFVDACFRNDEYKAAGIHNVIVDNFKLDLLKQLINNTLNHDESYSYSSYTPDHIVLRGHYIKLSDLYKNPHISDAKFVEIFALKKIFFDCDIYEHFSMSIIAPTWEIVSRININLSGKPGDAHTQQKATSGSSVSKPHGEDGAPGLPGGPGGNFVGIGSTIIDSEKLSIFSDGGRGGPGQDGGNGMDGTDDTECPDTIKDANYPHKLGCRSFHFAGLNRLYDEGCSAQSNFDGYSIDIRTIDSYAQRVTCYPKNDGPFEGNGANGGNGGKGGEGGYPGQILVIAKNNQSIHMINQVGNAGSNGKGGVGGEAGEKKRNLVINNELYPVDILEDYEYDNSEQDYKYVKSEGSYSPGNAGIDGYNAENIRHPERALSPSNFAHQSIVDYKTFAHKYSSGNTEDGDLINFLDFLERN